MSEDEQWTVVPGRDGQKQLDGQNVDDQSLIGSFVYKTTPCNGGLKTTPSDSDLIGAPFIINQPESAVDEVKTEGVGERGILKLTPDMVKEMESTRVEFTLNSMTDWPSFPDKGPRAIAADKGPHTDIPSDNKSWSNVLKSAPPTLQKTKKEEEPVTISDDDVETPKKKKKKKKAAQEGLIKDKQPLMLELGSLFETLQVKGHRKVVLSTGGGAMVSKSASNQTSQSAPRGGNILDASAPLIRRGKEREQPKKRKPTPLRKVINKEKEDRKARTESDIDVVNAVTKDETTKIEEINDKSDDVNSESAATPMVTNNETDVIVERSEESSDRLEASKKETKTVVKSKPQSAKATPTIHNKRFREYCTHVVTDEINECTRTLLSELLRFQDRQHQKDPLKAKVKKRYVCGMREVLKHLKSRRVKCLIVAPNMDRIQAEGGIDDVIGQILSLAEDQTIPIIFAMSRRALAVTLKKSHKVGCVGVFRHEGAEPHYKRLLELVEDARLQYKARSDGLLATSEPIALLLPVESDEELVVNGNEMAANGIDPQQNGTGLEHTPWGVFFKQPTTPPSLVDRVYSSTDSCHVSDHITPNVTTVTDHHMTSTRSHVTSPFNVFAKEFVPSSLSVHASEL